MGFGCVDVGIDWSRRRGFMDGPLDHVGVGFEVFWEKAVAVLCLRPLCALQ